MKHSFNISLYQVIFATCNCLCGGVQQVNLQKRTSSPVTRFVVSNIPEHSLLNILVQNEGFAFVYICILSPVFLSGIWVCVHTVHASGITISNINSFTHKCDQYFNTVTPLWPQKIFKNQYYHRYKF